MQRISVNLWFDTNQAEQAVDFYTSVFKNARVLGTQRYGEAGKEIHGQEPGSIMTVDFEIEGQSFVALNGGPYFTFTPPISFMVNYESANEVNTLWSALSEGGNVLMPLDSYPFSERYGWIEDRYGVSWQLILAEKPIKQRIVPSLMFVGERCGKAEEAISFYISVFRASKTGTVARYGANQKPDSEGTVMFADFLLENQSFAAMDSAQDHSFDFNEAISFIINCRNQDEIDYY